MFSLLLGKLIPLYTVIAIGYMAGRWLGVRKEAIARLLIYIIAPIVILSSIVNMGTLQPRLLTLPGIFLCLASLVAAITLRAARPFCASPGPNILAFSTGSGNTGYFGFPLVAAIMGQEFLGVAALMALGFILFENTLGYYLTARGRHTGRESLLRVAKLPTFYAFILAIALSVTHHRLPTPVTDLAQSFRGAYIILGMMMIGLGASQLTRASIKVPFVLIAFLGKFALWPSLVGLLVWLDNHGPGLFTANIHTIMLLMSLVPLPANSVAVASELQAEPEQAAAAVLASTVFALVYIPTVLGALGK